MTTTGVAVVVATFIFFSAIPSSSSCHVDDRRALLAFNDTLHWATYPPSWTPGSDCCFWQYIRCDKHGRVRVVSFQEKSQISGTIPPSVTQLPSLKILSFGDLPNLTGRILPEISHLSALEYLEITNTGVSRHIPASLGRLSQLRALYLYNNSLTGPIPASLGNCGHLFKIHLWGNKLTGTIPNTLYSKYSFPFTNLFLDLHSNQLTGDIPPELGTRKIMFIDLSNNMLTGESAAALFGESKPLSSITLANNRISFDLSTVKWPLKLTSVDLSHNQIYGSIPKGITTVPGLYGFDVSYNQLCGEIPRGGSFDKFGAESFQHNKCVCGTPLPPCK